MSQKIIFGFIFCFIVLVNAVYGNNLDKNEVTHTQEESIKAYPPPQPTAANITTAPTKPTTPSTPASSTTSGPPTTNASTTTSTSTTPGPKPTTPSTTPVPSTTTPVPSTTTLAPTTSSTPTNHTTPTPVTTPTPHPHPPPSDRKFDAFSFLGGFALGVGLVAIGILSWKFYLSRQENYYHTL